MSIRKTRRPFAVAGGVLALSGLLAGSLGANTPSPGDGTGEPRALTRAGRRLGLSDEQKTQIRGIIRSHAPEIEGQIQASRVSRRALREAMEVRPVDEAEIRRRALALGEVRADAAVLRARIRSEIWPVLTVEQQEKAKNLSVLQGKKSRKRMDALERWLRQDG